MKQEDLKRRFTKDIIIVIILLLAIGILIFLSIKSLYPSIPSFSDKAMQFCTQEDVSSVSLCNGQILEIASSIPEGGARYIHSDGTQFSCPAIAYAELSPDCYAINQAKNSASWSCEKIC